MMEKNIKITETHYRDYNGKILWKEKMIFSRLHAVGQGVIKGGIEYKVRRVAIADDIEHVNFEA